MTREQIEQMAIEYDRNLKRHPMSAGELRKDLVEFAMQVVKNCSIPDVVNRRELLLAYSEWWDKKYCPSRLDFHRQKDIDEFLSQ